jgi:hypothetical protein
MTTFDEPDPTSTPPAANQPPVVIPEVRINAKDLAFRVKMLDAAVCRVQDQYPGYASESLVQRWMDLELLLHGGS